MFGFKFEYYSGVQVWVFVFIVHKCNVITILCDQNESIKSFRFAKKKWSKKQNRKFYFQNQCKTEKTTQDRIQYVVEVVYYYVVCLHKMLNKKFHFVSNEKCLSFTKCLRAKIFDFSLQINVMQKFQTKNWHVWPVFHLVNCISFLHLSNVIATIR